MAKSKNSQNLAKAQEVKKKQATPTVSYGKKSLVYTKVCFVRRLVRVALCKALCVRFVRSPCALSPVGLLLGLCQKPLGSQTFSRGFVRFHEKALFLSLCAFVRVPACQSRQSSGGSKKCLEMPSFFIVLDISHDFSSFPMIS